MMAVRKVHLNKPRSINLLSHRMRSVIPVVEISHKDNGRSGRRSAIEVDGLGCVSRSVAIEASGTRYHIFTVIWVVGKDFLDLWFGRSPGFGELGSNGLTRGAGRWLTSRRAKCRCVISQDELLQNFALCPKPIAQSGLLAISSGAPKRVSAPFDLMLNAQVVVHCEKRRLLSSGLLSVLHLTLSFIPSVMEATAFLTAAALRISSTIASERSPPVGKTVCR